MASALILTDQRSRFSVTTGLRLEKRIVTMVNRTSAAHSSSDGTRTAQKGCPFTID